MKSILRGLKVLVWDFDGTLYRKHPKLLSEIREGELAVIRHHTGWSPERVRREFYARFPAATPSGTRVVSELAGIPMRQASDESAQYLDYRAYLRKDPKLVRLFGHLSRYIHHMLVNGTQESVRLGLSLLGVDASIFGEIVTSEVIGSTKPDPAGFRHVLAATGLPSAAHLMIGDREAVDLVPAKSLGMKTCLVWTDKKSEIADITLKTVYEMADVLG